MRKDQLHSTGTKARVGRARQTYAGLERQLKACRREVARVRARLVELMKQQTATSEILRIISDSPIQSVLDAVAEHAARLCDSSNAEIFHLENNLLRLVASYGEIPVAIYAREGIPANRDSVTGRAACDRRTVHVHNLAIEDSEYPLGSSNAKREGHRTTLATPLLREGTPIGVILIRRWEVRPFSDNQIALLEIFAAHAVIAIENVRLFEAEKQRALALAQANRDLAEDITERKRVEERLHVQHTIAQILAEAATIEEATLRILQAMGEYLGWDMGALWRVDREAKALRCVEHWHKASIEVPEFERVSRESTFVLGLGLPGRVWSSLEPEYVPDVVRDDNFPRGPIAEREGLHAALAFPILLGREALGVIEFFSREIREPDQELLNVLATIGSQIGQFIERKRGEEALRESDAKIRRLFDANIIGIFIWDFDGRILEANDAFLQIVGYDYEDLVAGRIRWTDLTPPEWRDRDTQLIQEHKVTGILRPFEKEYFRKDCSRVPVLIGVATFEEGGNQGVAFVVDLTERKRAEERLRHLESDLAHMNRVNMMGELAASLSHEITQPIGSASNNARAAQNFLDMQPPDLGEVREALSCVADDTDRAGHMIERMRDHLKKAPPRKEQFDLNEAISQVIALGRSTVVKNGVSVQTRLSERLSPIHGDRVQLQQVVLNLILNAVEAMGSTEAEARELLISTDLDDRGVLVAVRDSGPGLDPSHLERVFDAFYTTKSDGLGMGLSICRSIIDAHGGRLWAEANEPRGALFQFTLPAVQEGPMSAYGTKRTFQP
jgi:PAS domain S-box-containing protein